MIHVIARFANSEHLIRDTVERQEYLRRLEQGLVDSDWRAVAFAIMSSHPHLGLVAGTTPFEIIFRRVHSGFASWLNRRQGRLGPIFADRPDTIEVDLADALRFISYVHNNPVRAGVVSSAAGSTWTSHQAYLGQLDLQWMDVELGLQLCGLSESTSDRQVFDTAVNDRANMSEPWLSGRQLAEHRREARRQRGSAIEVGYPRVSLKRREAVYPVVAGDGVPLKPRWDGGVMDVIQAVSLKLEISVLEMRSCTRRRSVTRARKLAVLVYRDYLGRPLKDVAAAFGISPQAASRLAQRADDRLHTLANALADELATPVEAQWVCRDDPDADKS